MIFTLCVLANLFLESRGALLMDGFRLEVPFGVWSRSRVMLLLESLVNMFPTAGDCT